MLLHDLNYMSEILVPISTYVWFIRWSSWKVVEPFKNSQSAASSFSGIKILVSAAAKFKLP